MMSAELGFRPMASLRKDIGRARREIGVIFL